MTVRFKSEYQRSYGTSRSRSVSPLAGLRSDHMGTSREPILQRRRKAGLARSCGSLLFPPEPPEVTAVRRSAAPPAAAKSGSANKKFLPLTPPGPRPAENPALPEPLPLQANEVQSASEQKMGPKLQGQRSNEEEPRGKALDTSPLLAAQQMLQAKKIPAVAMETEYQRSFQAMATPTRPRPIQRLHHHRTPLFHTYMANRKWREEPKKEVQPTDVATTRKSEEAPPQQVLVEHRSPERGGATGEDTPQVVALRRQAASYRRRAWGCHFSRDHLSQLHSVHNALWEPSETTGSAPPTPGLTSDPGVVEPLELHRLSSRGASDTNEEEEEAVDGEAEPEEGRLPTPKLKMLPVQRTHHDITTPATGGALLVGTLSGSDAASSPSKQQGGGSAVAVAPGSQLTTAGPPRLREAWSANNPSLEDPGAPCRQKHPPTVAPPPTTSLPHCIQGSLRRADFQHNGELGLRLRELQRRHAGHALDEDDRMSVMSWRSAASCSAATAVLERAQRRRKNFWGKG